MKRSWLALVLVAAITAIPVAATSADSAKVGKTLDDRDLVRTGKWTSKPSASSYQGTLSKSKAEGARLTTTESTTNGGSVSFQFGPDRGKALILVGGVKKATVKTNANKKKTKLIKVAGSGQITIKVKKPGKGVYVDVVVLTDVGTPPATTPFPAAGQVIFTEWLSNPDMVAESNGEWFELQNLTAGTVKLTGCTVTNQASSSSTLSASNMLANNVFVFARNTNPTDNGGIIVDGQFTFALTTNGSLTLTCGGTVIDTVSWTGEISGQTKSLDPDHYSATDNDVAANYCPGTVAYGTGGDLGTPLEFNPQCP